MNTDLIFRLKSIDRKVDEIAKRIQAKDEALQACLKYLDGYPDNIFWPRPELIAKCKQALEK